MSGWMSLRSPVFGHDHGTAVLLVAAIRSIRECRLTRDLMSSKPIVALYESQ
jgi:hypothetical protein